MKREHGEDMIREDMILYRVWYTETHDEADPMITHETAIVAESEEEVWNHLNDDDNIAVVEILAEENVLTLME